MNKKSKAKVSIKVKGSPAEVKKALTHFAAPERIFREADFRERVKNAK